MRETILSKLNEIEEREGVRILHCAESGSRAWGFASPDSDYDVRFVYVRPREHYLHLERTRDVIEWQLDDTLDINGWDIQKALTLAHASNPTLLEWDASPILYKTTEAWRQVSSVVRHHFSVARGLYHYLNTARSNYQSGLVGETVRYKKYFYVLRPLLACRWILAEGTPPPVPFEVLKEGYLDRDILPEVEALLAIKRETSELGTGAPIPRLHAYLLRTMEEIEGRLAALPREEGKGWEELNGVFLSLLG